MKHIKNIQSYFLYFMVYSIIGWCYEVFLEVVVYRWGFSNRGFLFGPYLPIYGIGALVILFVLCPLQKKNIKFGRIYMTPFLVFLGIMLLTTGIELIASYLLEWKTGTWLWDYRRFAFDFEGRIALNPSIRFGIGGMIFLYVIQPLLEKGNIYLSAKARTWISIPCFLIISIDFILHISK